MLDVKWLGVRSGDLVTNPASIPLTDLDKSKAKNMLRADGVVDPGDVLAPTAPARAKELAIMCEKGMKAEIESLCPGSAGGQGRSLSDYVLEKVLRGDYAD